MSSCQSEKVVDRGSWQRISFIALFSLPVLSSERRCSFLASLFEFWRDNAENQHNVPWYDLTITQTNVRPVIYLLRRSNEKLYPSFGDSLRMIARIKKRKNNACGLFLLIFHNTVVKNNVIILRTRGLNVLKYICQFGPRLLIRGSYHDNLLIE